MFYELNVIVRAKIMLNELNKTNKTCSQNSFQGVAKFQKANNKLSFEF